MGNLSNRCAIVGVGTSRFGKMPGVSTMGFTLEASRRAMEDAGLQPSEIDGVLVLFPAVMGEQHGWAARVAAYLGIEPRFCATMDLGGATACGSVQTAVAAIQAGYCETVLCCFGMQNWPQGIPLQLFGSEFQLAYGDVGAICLMAHIKRRQQFEYRWPDEMYGEIAVTWRRHAQQNPQAQMRKPMALADYFASRWIAEPLRLFDCCPSTDGGAACIVTSRERARDLRQKPVFVVGAGQSHSAEMISPAGKTDGRWGGQEAAVQAYGMAGVSAGDFDVAQLYDAFTPRVAHDLVAYGFCAPQDLPAFVASSQLTHGGTIPCNTAGGLLSEGHLSGFGHIQEAVYQLRGTAGPRQVPGAELALVTGYGGAPHEAPPTVSYAALVLGQ